MEYWTRLYHDNYAISTFGRIWSARYGPIKTPNNNHGYPHCNIRVNGKTKRIIVHQEVGKRFIENPENKPTINHKDGVRCNNNLSNLEWATHSEQNIHSVAVLGRKGALNNHRRKEVMAYKEGCSIVLSFNGIRECARFLEIPYQAVQTGIKIKTRIYFGWQFELLSDPGWKPKERRRIPEVLRQYVDTE